MEEEQKKIESPRERLERLQSVEKKEEDEKLRVQAEARNLADLDEILNYANKKKKLVLTSLGFYVEYMPLRIEDRTVIRQIQDSNPEVQINLRNRKMVYLILSRADPRYTEKVVNNLPAPWVDAILFEYDREETARFLLPIIRRGSSGLGRTSRRNE